MAIENGQDQQIPAWFVSVGEADILAWISLGILFLAIYCVVFLYAAFDRWAEQMAHGTPLARTIPTMLAIALLYEIFPLGHFHILLPISAILIALMADWSRFHTLNSTEINANLAVPAPTTLDGNHLKTQAEENQNA